MQRSQPLAEQQQNQQWENAGLDWDFHCSGHFPRDSLRAPVKPRQELERPEEVQPLPALQLEPGHDPMVQ